MTATTRAGRDHFHSARAAAGIVVALFSVPAFFVAGAMSLLFVVVGAVLLGSSFATHPGPATRAMAVLLTVGVTFGLFTCFVKVVQ